MSDQPGQPPVPPEPAYPPQPPAEPVPPAVAPQPQQPYPAPPQQPYPAQAYPPQAPYPPQPYPPQGGQVYAPQPGTVPPSAPAPKKRRVWLWIVVVVLLLLCCGASAVAGVIGLAAQQAANDAAAIKKADDAYTKAVEGLESASAAMVVDETTDVTTVTTTLDDSKASLGEARAAISGLSESPGRTSYLQGLDEADKAVETLRSAAEEASGKSRFLQLAEEGIALYDQGSTFMNASVGLSNKDQYRPAGVQAGKARTAFTQSRAKLVEADAMEPTADLEKSIQYVDLQLQKVDYTIQLNNHGARGEISSYNKVVPKFNAINAKIKALPEPEALSDPTWATRMLETLQTQFTDYLTKSGELIDSAHTLLSGASSN